MERDNGAYSIQVGQEAERTRHLLQEIHHQVKNNLQVVCSLLRIQSRTVADVAAKAAFKRGEERIQSMALVYEMLYHGSVLSQVPVGKYLPEMARQLLSGNGTGAMIPSLSCSIDTFSVSSRVATHLGLLVNELLSHRLRQAFGDKGLLMHLSFTRSESTALLVLQDSGPPRNQSVGINAVEEQILEALIRQLQGQAEYPDGDTFLVRITIPNSALIDV